MGSVRGPGTVSMGEAWLTQQKRAEQTAHFASLGQCTTTTTTCANPGAKQRAKPGAREDAPGFG